MSRLRDREWSISYSEEMSRRIRSLAADAKSCGRKDDFLRCFRVATDSMKTEPAQWGDLLGHLHALNLAGYRGMFERLVVHFDVDHHRRIVYIRDITYRMD